MKKEYTKPVMEGEAFVANEYVAACWTVECLNCKAYDEVHQDVYKEYSSSVGEPVYGDIYMYSGEIDGVDPCLSNTTTTKPEWVTGWWGELFWTALKWWFGFNDPETTTYYHTIQFQDGWTHTNHPNASV